MNAQIVKLFGFVIVLYALLFGFTSYWSVFDADNLEANTANKRPLLEEERIDRGDILANDEETVIAKSEPQGEGDGQIFVREYPEGELYGNPIGYSFVQRGRVGTELAHNDELVGDKTEFLSILDELQGRQQEGSTLVASLDPEAQETALDALGGQKGSVVAMVPDTGEIRAMVSVPTYDPNLIPDEFETFNKDENAPLFNRATQAGYQPGSTMKVVTATAALEDGVSPDETLSGRSPVEISGVPLQDTGGEQFGEIDMTTALTNSVNTWWAQMGEQLGTETMYKYMDRFGFNEQPPLDYPSFQIAESGEFADGELLDAGSDEIDVGRMAIGQDKLNVTPLQMAMVAAAVANDGELMEPRLWSKVIDQDGREDEMDPDRQSRVMSEDNANILTDMMTDVVNEGTGGAAALSSIQVAGKTGTAEIDIENEINQAWFIGFAPADDPKIAIAATVERTGGFGGTVAAPIAQQVMEVLLSEEEASSSEEDQ